MKLMQFKFVKLKKKMIKNKYKFIKKINFIFY